MKKMLIMLVALSMAFSLMACGGGSAGSAAPVKQNAEAYLDQSEAVPVVVNVDLTGGWSVEFARGAAYIYDKEITPDNPGIGMLITLDKQVYDEYMAEAELSVGRKEADGGVYYDRDDGGVFIGAVDEYAYYMISTDKKEDIETVRNRCTVTLEQ